MRHRNQNTSPHHARVAVLSQYLEVAERLGFNPVPALRKVGLSKAMLANREQKIPIDTAIALLEESASMSGCEAFGLMMADARSISDMGPISLLLNHQRTLADALYTISQYRHLMNESLGLYVESMGRLTLIHEEVISDNNQIGRQAIELAVGVMCNICRTLTNVHWKPQSINFMHSPPSDLSLHKKILRGTLQFDSDFNGLTCLTTDMHQPNPHADPVMAKYAQGFMDSLPKGDDEDLRHEVRKSIYLLLPMGRASITYVATSLGISARTLQRRLDDSGESFSDLLSGVRRELSSRYLRNSSYSMSRIATQLGYSNQSAFTRWFITDQGTSPTEFRRNMEARK